MSKFLTPRNVAIAGGVGAAVLLFPRTMKTVKPGEGNSNVFETPGVKNVGDRYATNGGTSTHMPGAATPLGSSDRQAPNKQDLGGASSGKFKDRISDQKTNPNPVAKEMYEMALGNEKGK